MSLYPNDDTVGFIAQHRHEKVHDLALQASRFKEVDMGLSEAAPLEQYRRSALSSTFVYGAVFVRTYGLI